MTTADRAADADDFDEFGARRSHRAVMCNGSMLRRALVPCLRTSPDTCRLLPWPASKLLPISALLSALAVAGCATDGAQPAANPKAVHLSAPVHPTAERAVRALLVPQHPPDCELKQPKSETLDAAVWARLKLDYERRCYQKAEVVVRKRLRRVQASLGKCDIERRPARQPLIAGPATVLPVSRTSTNLRQSRKD